MKISPSHSDTLDQYIQAIILERLRLVSKMLIFTYPLFFIVDFFLFKGVGSTYHTYLALIHAFCFFLSILYLLLARSIKVHQQDFVIHSYIFIYLLIGALSSLNSQLLTGNIMAYLIILIGACAIFPLKPRNLGILILANHLFFLWGLNFLETNYFSLLTKIINSTGAAVIGFLIAYSFYSFRKKDFTNQNKLKNNMETFHRLFHMNPSPLILLNLKTDKIELLNKQAKEHLQLLNGDTNELNGNIIFQNKEEKNNIVNRLTKKEQIDNYFVKHILTPDIIKWSEYHFELVEYLDHNCLLIGLSDITHLKQAEEKLFKQASFDILTGVMNRRAGMEKLKLQLLRPEEFILYFVDINNLKIVNDQLGHAEGDELIKTVCEVINRKLDSEDFIFRYGGDEFIVVFLNKTQTEVIRFWKLVQQEFTTMNKSKHRTYPISVSFGYYHYRPEFSITLEEILEHADQEMYKVKSASKG